MTACPALTLSEPLIRFRLTLNHVGFFHLVYNRFIPPRKASEDTGHWSTPDNHHSFGLFRLKHPDQALFVSFVVDDILEAQEEISAAGHEVGDSQAGIIAGS